MFSTFSTSAATIMMMRNTRRRIRFIIIVSIVMVTTWISIQQSKYISINDDSYLSISLTTSTKYTPSKKPAKRKDDHLSNFDPFSLIPKRQQPQQNETLWFDGVLPIKRFCIKEDTGRSLETLILTSSSSSSKMKMIQNENDLIIQCHQMCVFNYEDCDAWETVVLDFEINTLKCTLFAQPLKQKADDNVNDTNKSYSNADQWNNKNPFSNKMNLPSNSYRKKFQKQQHSYVHTKFLAAWQAPDNSQRYTVGFVQRRAKVLTRTTITTAASHRSDRILYVLHYHHPVPSSGHLDLLLNQLLISYLPPDMFDLVVVTPNEEILPITSSSDVYVSSTSSLVNPFVPKDGKSKLGSNSYMSISLAQAKFPGYKGYLLVNDDAVLRFWDMMDSHNSWFDYRPWVTEPLTMEDLNHPSQQIKRGGDKYDIDDKLYTDWNWWNKDSGSTTWPPPHLARSNFDAALAALNELCETSVAEETDKPLFSGLPAEVLCQGRANNSILVPYVHGKADVFYVPNGPPFGPAFLKSLRVFGSHDVFLEISVPIIYQLVVPNTPIWREDPLWGLSAPYCQRAAQGGGQIAFEVVHSREGQIHPDLQCTVLHPLKFSRIENVDYWREVVREECWVRCDDYSKTPWRVIL